MRIMNNISAMNAHRLYTNNNSKLSKSLEKLSSGYAINRAGDNAAGLAVSEKMRAQIAGLEQASKNAQDGISMVQTYEGALTETDSILQRMRSLAVQSANGTYDNSVDRVAIEQEYKQLNDELNQIADTDFNGVVVLNGGQMADGLKQVDGVFDYDNKSADVAATLAKKTAALEAEKAAIDKPEGINPTTIDDVKYTADAANQLWEDLGIDASDVDTIEVNFVADKDGNFTAATAVAKKGTTEVETEIDLSKFVTAKADKASGTGEGGFTISNSKGEISNVIFDATDISAGDAVKVTFTNTDNKTYAPKNIGFEDNSSNELNGKFSSNGDAKITLADTVTDDALAADTAAWKTVLDELNKASIDVTYTADGTADTAAITVADGKADISGTTKFSIKKVGDVFEISLAADEGSIKKDTVIATFTPDTGVKELAGQTAADTVAKYGVKLDKYNFADATNVPDASATTGTPDMKAYDKAIAEIDEKIADLKKDVSVSDALNQSTSKLTYVDGMKLQVGARTKDIVDFTFQYDADSIGELKADLDCSARGLGTDQLSLATQESANAAIDKIDHAINKISMVRGTFGAIQNRLEHKISNLDTNNENLSAAESRIRDTDMAAEMMEFTKNQILSQASQSMLAQANQLPQGVLSLLQ